MSFKFKKPLTSSRGAALITILGFSAVIITILQSVLFDSKAEHIAAQHKLNELRARYSARAGVELNMLRVLMYRQAQALVSNTPAANLARPYLDFLWQLPFVWPLPHSELQSDAEKQEIKKILNSSLLKLSGYNSIITPEDGKIDLNDLSSPIIYLQRFAFDTLLEILRSAVNEDKELKENYQDGDLIEIVNNLADWTDFDNNSRNGGNEQIIDEEKLPLNRAFISIEEIKKTPKVTEDIYNILKPHVTVYGSKGLNINYASAQTLSAMGFSEQSVEIILSRTQLGGASYSPFSDKKTFCQYMEEQALDICGALEAKYNTSDMLQFNTALHFRIESSGQSKESSYQAETLVFDAYRLSSYYREAVKTHKKLMKDDQNSKPPSPKKPDTQKINYNSNSPVFIMYWKENF